ncbi:MAG: OmpA family protein [Beijerinckiaceae bacterium]
MRDFRQALLAGVVTPALVLSQAMYVPALAQAQQNEQKPREAPKAPPPPPAAQPHTQSPPRAAPPAPPPAAPRPMTPPPQQVRPPVAPPPAAPRPVAPPPPHVAPPPAPPHATTPPRPTVAPPPAPAPVAPRPAPSTIAPAPNVQPAPPAHRLPGAVAPNGGPTPQVSPTLRPQGAQPAPPQNPQPGLRPGVQAPPASPNPPPQTPAGQPPAQPGAQPNAQPVAPAQPLRVPDGPPPGQRPTPLQPNALPPQGQPGAPPPAIPQQQGARPGRITPGAAAAIGAGAGLVGGFMMERQGAASRGIDAIRQERRAFNQDGAEIFQEPGRTIVRDEGRFFVRHDENERFRMLGANLQTQRRGDETISVWRRPDGAEIITITDSNGDLVRRYRRMPDGAEIIIIDNRYSGPPRAFVDNVVVLPPPRYDLAPERYIVDAESADERALYDTLSAPPVAPIPRRFTLDEVRYSPDVRAYTRSVDVNTISFATNSWVVEPGQAGKLAALARAINEAVGRNPSEVFLVEGHTDAVGNPVDNLSLSDRRAQSVADILTRDFAVPPENLVTQGYGAQNLRVQTSGPEIRNRRVVIRRITPLLNGQNG